MATSKVSIHGDSVDYTLLNKSGITNRGPFRRAALKSYLKRMSQSNENALFDKFVAQNLAYQGIAWEEKPRSIYQPQQLYDTLALFGRRYHKQIEFDPALEAGVRLAYKLFAKPSIGYGSDGLSAISSDVEVVHALDLSKSAGLPTMGKKKDDVIYALDREKQVLSEMKHPNPCVAGARTSKNNKTRLVWMFPLEMTIMEARFARPLINKFLYSRTPMAFGMYKYELGARLSWEVEPYGFAHCLDYSKFDSSIPAKLIDIAFAIMGTWFSEEDKSTLGWDIIKKYFICTPIVLPDGNLYIGKDHGVPSGSYFTQLVDSIVNVMMIGAIMHTFHVNTSWRSIFVLGDDSIFPVPWKLNLEKVRSLLSKYGINLNVEKSVINEMHFLGAEWEKCLPHANPKELASKLVFPEHFRKYDPAKPVQWQANNVVANYASQYVEAFKFINLDINAEGLENILANFVRMAPEVLSGSDLYRWRMMLAAGMVENEPSRAYTSNPNSVPTVRILT